MNELTLFNERKRYTTKQVAKMCGVTVKTVVVNAEKIGKKLVNGKTNFWTENELKQLQLVLMKNQIDKGNSTKEKTVENNLYDEVKAGLTLRAVIESGNEEALEELIEVSRKAMKAKKLERKNAELERENKSLQIELDYSKDFYTVKRVAKINNLNWKDIEWKLLKDMSFELGKPIIKIFDANYGYVNSYHIDVWNFCYPELNY